MRKIILMAGMSLDGYIEGPERQIDWHRVDEELHQHFNDELRGMSAFLSGRVTHELMADFWPTADEDPQNAGTMAEFARIWRDMPKYAFSRTMQRADWNTTIVREVDPDAIRALKEQPGGDMTLSGAGLAAAFMRQGLVDEYRVYIHPVLIGRGKPLFSPSDAMVGLRLLETRVFDNGVLLTRYAEE
ncbi:dihydrofolate reductase family protein [Streptomyces sp. NPDC054887]